jgi:dynein heavy chain
MVRECSADQSKDLKWVLFDGPVDTLWIESMNTVLDDNKKLCLNSGEIVSLSNEMTMMFEPRDLSVASPATVSRCGMIYMEPKSLGFDPVLQSWMEKLPKCFDKIPIKAKLKGYWDTYLVGALFFLRRSLTEPLATVDNNLNASIMRLLDCFFEPFKEKEGRDVPSAKALGDLMKGLPAIFIFSFVWSVCATVNIPGRKKFDSYMRAEMFAHGFPFPLPQTGLLYDFCWNQTTFSWVPWMDTAPEYKYNPKLGFDELVIPTQDTIRYTYILNQLLINNKCVMMTGPTGTGKSVNINNHLQTGMPDTFIPLCFTFSAQTSANQTQDIIDGKTEKRRKAVYGPPAGKQFVIFVDDVNMPMREVFFAQPPIELLRQLLGVSGWFDRSTREWKSIIDWTMVIACGPPGKLFWVYMAYTYTSYIYVLRSSNIYIALF